MERIAKKICEKVFFTTPTAITRCTVGQGNYVFIVECKMQSDKQCDAKSTTQKYVIRFNDTNDSYKDSIFLLERLAEIKIPVPKVIASGRLENYGVNDESANLDEKYSASSAMGFDYLVISFIEGKDLGLVYRDLRTEEKKQIAKEVVKIQNDVAKLRLENVPSDWNWISFVDEMLDRAKNRILQNGYFDVEKVERLEKEKSKTELLEYFSSVEPIPYLDDISTKNLMICDGHVSGIVDIDWIGLGDKFTFVAMTYIALLNMDCDAEYVDFLLRELKLTDAENRAFLFYSLLFCIDFMCERGTRFMDKVVEVNDAVVSRLNKIYDTLWEMWIARGKKL